MQKILLVEDDQAILCTLQDYLKSEGFETEAVSGAEAAAEKIAGNRYQLLLVDVALEDGDGFQVCRAAKTRNMPVIFLTASGDENSVVTGLDLGADDYVAKPFRPRELMSRIRSVIRRTAGDSPVTVIGPVEVDSERGSVRKNGEELALSALEYRLFQMFVSNRGRLLTRDRLLEEIWDLGGDFVNDNTLTVYIKRLREKIEEDPQNPQIIKTVRGLGYRMDG